MKKIMLGLLLLLNFAFAQVINIPISPAIVNSGIKIIDIRTPAEWRESGIIKGSKTIMFFDEQGKYNVPKFLSKLNAYIKPGEKFAVVCRTGHRSRIVSNFLGKNGYKVVDLLGGVMALAKQNYKFVKYENSN